VAKQNLDDPDVGSVLQQIRREAVPQRVQCDVLRQARRAVLPRAATPLAVRCVEETLPIEQQSKPVGCGRVLSPHRSGRVWRWFLNDSDLDHTPNGRCYA
jgi:hypothetical protein